MFKAGQRVVHPRYGVGRITRLEDRSFEPGVARRYYEIAIEDGGTVWVPVESDSTGLRRLAAKSEISNCRRILRSQPARLTADARAFQAEASAHLKRGTIAAQCEVVRDVSAYTVHNRVSGQLAVLLKAAQDVLCQEWAVVEGVSVPQAQAEVESLLAKGRGTEDGKRGKES